MFLRFRELLGKFFAGMKDMVAYRQKGCLVVRNIATADELLLNLYENWRQNTALRVVPGLIYLCTVILWCIPARVPLYSSALFWTGECDF